MKLKKAKKTSGGVELWFSCEHCGKPISRTSYFGMDCEDQCAEKAWMNSLKETV